MSEVSEGAVELQEVVHRLVSGLHPERIYLFGSRATHAKLAPMTRFGGYPRRWT